MADAGNILQGIGTGLTGIANSMNMYDETKKRREELALQKEQLAMQKTKFQDEKRMTASGTTATILMDAANGASSDKERVSGFSTGVKILQDNRAALDRMSKDLDKPLNISWDKIESGDKGYIDFLHGRLAGASGAMKVVQENAAKGIAPSELDAVNKQSLKSLGAWVGEGWMRPVMERLTSDADTYQARRKEDAGIRNTNAGTANSQSQTRERDYNLGTEKTADAEFKNATGMSRKGAAAVAGPGTQQELTLAPDQENVPNEQKKFTIGPKKDLQQMKMSRAQKTAFTDFTNNEAFGKTLLTQRVESQRALEVLSMSRNDKNAAEYDKQIGTVVPMLELQLAKAANGGRPTEEDAVRLVFNKSYPDRIKRWFAAGAVGKDMPKDVESLKILSQAMVDYSNSQLKRSWANFARGTGRIYGEDFDVDATLEGGMQAMGLDPASADRVDIDVGRQGAVKTQNDNFLKKLDAQRKLNTPQRPQGM